MVLDAFLAQFYKAVIVVLLALLALAVAFGAWKHFALEHSESQREADIAKAIKPYVDAIDLAQQEKVTIMQTWSAKIIEVEQNAIKKIQDANAAARSADLAASGLSKQLSEANKRLSTASKETIIEYTVTNSELLEACTAEYRSMAEKADGHAIDVERLSEAWP
ncbi:hypothetical protein [Acinetobacter lwoffii]|uniref:hypothetical protein n=1 Tax=Acinetobacter lwoffii TaxID=28090 RepID=UPI00300BD300